MTWDERYYQYGSAIAAFSIWAYYLASITSNIPIEEITFDPFMAFVAVITFVALAPVLHPFIRLTIGSFIDFPDLESETTGITTPTPTGPATSEAVIEES